jgi:hypothetical protein
MDSRYAVVWFRKTLNTLNGFLFLSFIPSKDGMKDKNLGYRGIILGQTIRLSAPTLAR